MQTVTYNTSEIAEQMGVPAAVLLETLQADGMIQRQEKRRVYRPNDFLVRAGFATYEKGSLKWTSQGRTVLKRAYKDAFEF